MAGFQVVFDLCEGLFEPFVVISRDVEPGPVLPFDGGYALGGDVGDLGLPAEFEPVLQGDGAEVAGLRGYGDWGGGSGPTGFGTLYFCGTPGLLDVRGGSGWVTGW